MSENMNFEAALTELEDAVRRLEGGAMTLDESLVEFEKAVKLVKVCNGKLEAAEQRVRILTEGLDGVITDAPFAAKNEN